MRITRGNCPNQGDCNFEDETLCEYDNMADSNFNWIVKSGAGPNLFTGPTFDHTYGNGYNGFYVIAGKN